MIKEDKKLLILYILDILKKYTDFPKESTIFGTV